MNMTLILVHVVLGNWWAIGMSLIFLSLFFLLPFYCPLLSSLCYSSTGFPFVGSVIQHIFIKCKTSFSYFCSRVPTLQMTLGSWFWQNEVVDDEHSISSTIKCGKYVDRLLPWIAHNIGLRFSQKLQNHGLFQTSITKYMKIKVKKPGIQTWVGINFLAAEVN